MSWINYDDAISQLKGVGLVEPKKGWQIDTLRPMRCDWTGSQEPLRGWFHLATYNIDGDAYIVGAFGYWQGDDNNKFKIELSKKCNACGHENSIKNKECEKCGAKSFASKALNDDQKKAMAKQRAEAIRQAEILENIRQERIADLATKAWYQLSKEGDCGYLQRKGVEKYHDFKYGTGEVITLDILDENNQPAVMVVPNDKDSLIIPVKDFANKIWGLQIIRNKPEKFQLQKEFWPKGFKLSGNFYTIGNSNQEVELVAEGLATALTLYQSNGKQYKVHVAFNANNILHAAHNIKKANKRAKLLFCADDDYLVTCKAKLADNKQCNHVSPAGTEICPACGNEIKNKGRAGERACADAALAVGGAWVKPIFPADREGKKLTDFNDLANFPNCSESTVRVQIEDKLTQLGWGYSEPSAPRAGAHKTGGGGERPNAVSVMDVDSLVERFIPIDDGLGETVFDTWTHKLASKKQMLALMPAGAKLDDIKRHYVFQTRGAFYLDDVGFDPTEKDTRVKLNLWTGWEMQPKAGNCKRLLETLEYLCSQEKNADDILWWIIKWMAYPLQNPGAKMASALILHGPQGTGKSLIFRTLAKIYGKYATVIGNSGIEDKFNADWSDSKLMILAEEIATSADKWQIKNELKELITGETVRVRAMHRMAYHQKNHMNLIFLSNEDMPLPIEQDDRRHCVVYTPPALPKTHYNQVLEDLDNGGVEAFYDFLLNVDLAGFTRHTQPPTSGAKQNLIMLSLPSDKRFIKEWTDGTLELPVCPCKSMSLYKAYLDWCKANGEPRPRPSNQFLGMVNNLSGWQAGLKRVFSNLNYLGEAKPTRVVIPSNEILASHGEEKPADKTETQWLTDGVVHFDDKHENGNGDAEF